MKKTSLLLLLLGLGALPLNAAVTETYSFTGLSDSVPDGNPSGIVLSYDATSYITSVASVRITLDISSDSNGSLYAYLQHGDGLCVLLNRAGRTASNLAGYDDNGFNITFDDSLTGRDIHQYNAIEAPTVGQPLTGSWQTDARNVDPDLVLDTDARTATLAAFNSMSGSGTWTLFIASMESGGTTTLNGWSMELSGVPEPMTCTLATGAVLLGFAAYRKLRA